MLSGGRAEIKNIKNSVICDIFNFSSATRERFSNVDPEPCQFCKKKNDVWPRKVPFLVEQKSPKCMSFSYFLGELC